MKGTDLFFNGTTLYNHSKELLYLWLGMRRQVYRKAFLSAITATLLVALMPYFYQSAVHVHTAGAAKEQKAGDRDSDQCLLCHFHNASAVEATPTIIQVVLTPWVRLTCPSVAFHSTLSAETVSLRAPPILLA